MADRIITVTNPSVVTNDTLDSYNNYTNQPSPNTLIGPMTIGEAAAGKTVSLSDGSVHEVTTKPVGTTNGEFTAVVSNAVTVDLSGGGGGYDPTLADWAVDPTSATPTDVSGGSNNLIANGARNLPTYATGVLSFNETDDNLLTLTTPIALAGDFTFIFKIGFDGANLYPASACGFLCGQDDGFSDNKMDINSADNGWRMWFAEDDSTTNPDASASFTPGGAMLTVTLKRVGTTVTLQFGAGTPITIIGNSTFISNTFTLKNFGGYFSIARSFNGRFARMLVFNSVGLTGTALTDAQAWVENA